MSTCETALLIWMVCGAHLMYLSFQSPRKHSIRYRGTVPSWTVGHRAVTDLQVLHFCTICAIAFTRVCVLSNILSSCAFVSPHHRTLKIKFIAVSMYTLLPLHRTRGYSDVLIREEPLRVRFCSINKWIAQILVKYWAKIHCCSKYTETPEHWSA